MTPRNLLSSRCFRATSLRAKISNNPRPMVPILCHCAAILNSVRKEVGIHDAVHGQSATLRPPIKILSWGSEYQALPDLDVDANAVARGLGVRPGHCRADRTRL